MRLVLVYQCGIANLFRVNSYGLAGDKPFDRCQTSREYQGGFRSAENMARGAILAGAHVRVASCNMAGDIRETTWMMGLADCPFRDETSPPRQTKAERAAPGIASALSELLNVANEYSDAMKKIGRGHRELGADAPTESAAGRAAAALRRIRYNV